MTLLSPLAVVQAQLDAYNAKDLDALMATYAPNAQQFALHGALLAEGHDQIRPRYEARFVEPDLHAALDRFLAEHADEPKRIFCTYTAMMTLRRTLAERYDLPDFGEDAAE